MTVLFINYEHKTAAPVRLKIPLAFVGAGITAYRKQHKGLVHMYM